jgi:hypothetical protein
MPASQEIKPTLAAEALPIGGSYLLVSVRSVMPTINNAGASKAD